MPEIGPLDHYVGRPEPDAAEEVHAEADKLARVAIAAGEAMARSRAQRGAREAKALADNAKADLVGAVSDLEKARSTAAGAEPGSAAQPTKASTLEGATSPTTETEELLGMSGPPTSTAVIPDATGPTASADLGQTRVPRAEGPLTLAELLDASHPFSISEELAAAQLRTSSTPAAAALANEAGLVADIGLR
ncbi:MAG: hypothetical protein ACP5VR_13485 [Acidimicrobiales bacterium]